MNTQQTGQQKDKYLYLLSEIADIVSSSLAEKDIFDGVTWELANMLDVDACWIQNYNPSDKMLMLVSQRGLPEPMLKELEFGTDRAGPDRQGCNGEKTSLLQ